jgi:hypothetical protein
VTASLDQAAIRNTIDHLRAIRPALAEAVAVAANADLATAIAPEGISTPRTVNLPVIGGRTLATLVLGCGRGGMARAIAASLRDNDAPTVVIVIETDPARLLATLVCDDWSAVLAEPRIRFAVGTDPRETVPAAVPEAPFCLLERGLNPGVGLVPGDEPARSEEIQARADTAAGIVLAEFKRACQEQAARHPASDGPPTLPTGRWRIHSSVSTSTTALKHLAPSILGAAGRAGHTTLVQLAESSSDPFVSSRTSIASLDSEADLVVGFLRPGRSIIPWRDDFPSLVLVSSNPRLLPIETFAWSDRDLVVVTDPDFAEAYRGLGLDPLVRSLATEVPSIAKIEATPSPECDVLLVGNIPPASSVVEDLSEKLQRLIEEMAADWVQHPDATIDEVIATTTIRGDEAFLEGIRLALGYETTRRRRIGTAITLAEAGFAVRVHGEEAWREALAETAAEGCWHGWMPSGVAQSAAFRRAGVSINVNSLATPNMINMRGFEVPAAGGVLVSDDRPALRAAFDVGTEVLAFRRLDELPDLVGDVLRDRDRRDAIAAAARARVERDHSWDAWWAWAEKELRARFPSRK